MVAPPTVVETLESAAAQTAQILTNIGTALAAVDAGLEDIIEWNRCSAPRLITAVFVKGLGHPDWLAEI